MLRFRSFVDIYTKSKTYQKEGWSILEEENQVFGKAAEAVDNKVNLESEDFYFYNQNKEEAKSNIDSSSKEITDFIDSLIQDVPEPTEDQVNAGIENILEKTHPEGAENSASKSSKGKKVTFRVLFIAALLSMISFSCLYVVGNSHNISIENGFVTFAKETVKIVFFGETEEEYITVDVLLTDLKAHGYEDFLFPQEFVNNHDEYKVSIPEYVNSEFNQVGFNVHNEEATYLFIVHKYDQKQNVRDFDNLKTADSIKIDGTYVYMFEFDTGESAVEFICDNYHVFIHSSVPYSDIVEIAKTLK